MSDRTIGRYRVIGVLGAGGMGEVLRARDERLGRDVAIKRVKNVCGALTAQFHARFEAEARALAALAHPGVVQVYDLGTDGDEPYLVMELVDGPSLRSILNERGPLPTGDVRALGIQLARALEAAHARGILHRDIKPANVLRAPDGIWKLADFGVAHMPDSEMTMAGQFIGTPAYAAPEALARGDFSPSSDVFGLAVTLVEAAIGANPRRDVTVVQLIARARDPVALGGVDPMLAAALAPALGLDPSARPSAGAFARWLAGEVAPLPTATSTVSLRGPAPARHDVSTQTVHVPDETSPPAAQPSGTVAVPDETAWVRPARPRARWQRAAVGAAGAALVLVLIGRSCAEPAGRKPAAGVQAARPAPTPARDEWVPSDDEAPIVFETPPGLDQRGLHAWSKVADEVRAEKYDDALEKLWQFERRFGESDESVRLRTWLDQQVEHD